MADTTNYRLGEEKTLNDYIQYINGKPHEKLVSDDGTFTLVNSKFISTDGRIQKNVSQSELIAKNGDVLMVLSDVPNGKAIAKTFYVESDNKYAVNQRIAILRTDKMDSKYLYYLLNRNRYFLGFDDGNKQTNLSKEDILSFKFRLPSFEKQQKFALLLTDLDSQISNYIKQKALLEQKKKHYLNVIFNDKHRDDAIKVRLDDISKFRRGSFPQPYGSSIWYDEDNGQPFVQVYDVDDNLRLKDKTKSKISKLAEQYSVFVPKDSVIVTLQGTIGKVALTQYDCFLDRTLLYFEHISSNVDKIFFLYCIHNIFDSKKRNAPGGVIKTITKTALSSFEFYLPDITIQKKYSKLLYEIDNLLSV